MIADVFQGIEIELLAGVRPEDAPHREVLDALGAVIERAEAPWRAYAAASIGRSSSA